VIVEQLVEKTMNTQVVQAAQAVMRQTESTEVAFEKDRLKSTQMSQRTQIELKVVVDGKLGSSSSTDPADLEGIVSRALATAPFGTPVSYRFPGPEECPAVEVYDEAVVSATTQDMIQIGEEMTALIKDHNGQILVDAEVGKDVSKVELANCAGTQLSTEMTSFGAGVEAMLVRGTDVLSVDDGIGWRTRALDHSAIARETIEWFRLAENLVEIPSGDMPVIFTSQGVAILLMSLQMGLDGKNVLLGASPLADDLGRRRADPRFSLVDDPLIDYGVRSSPFDGEGVVRQRTTLIEDGVVRNFLYDLDTASRAGAESTGHGPHRGPTNLLIGAGDVSHEDMVKSVKAGLLVHSVLGLGQGNAMGGEFSVNVHLGYKIEDGEIVGRVKDVMLAGNVYDALQDIVAISADPQWRMWPFPGAFPYIQVGGLSVVAR
jgi:PmbA protein